MTHTPMRFHARSDLMRRRSGASPSRSLSNSWPMSRRASTSPSSSRFLWAVSTPSSLSDLESGLRRPPGIDRPARARPSWQCTRTRHQPHLRAPIECRKGAILLRFLHIAPLLHLGQPEPRPIRESVCLHEVNSTSLKGIDASLLAFTAAYMDGMYGESNSPDAIGARSE